MDSSDEHTMRKFKVSEILKENINNQQRKIFRSGRYSHYASQTSDSQEIQVSGYNLKPNCAD